MLRKEDVGRLLDYTVWANRRVMRAAATLTTDQFRRDLDSSHGGVRGTLTHIMGGEWIWLERFKGVSPRQGIDEGEFPDVIALRARWKTIEKHRESWFETLKESALAQVVRYTNMKGQALEGPLWQLVQHVVNHSTYHRGQVTTLLRLLGARPVSTDLLYFDLEQRQKAKR